MREIELKEFDALDQQVVDTVQQLVAFFDAVEIAFESIDGPSLVLKDEPSNGHGVLSSHAATFIIDTNTGRFKPFAGALYHPVLRDSIGHTVAAAVIDPRGRTNVKKIEVIREVPFFKPLRDEDLRELAEICGVQGYVAGTKLFAQGDPSDSFFIIVAGEIEIRLHPSDGSPPKIYVLGDGSFFGEMGVMRNAPRSGDAFIKSDAVLLKIMKTDFDRLMAVNKFFSGMVMESFLERSQQLLTARAPVPAPVAPPPTIATSAYDDKPRGRVITLFSPAGGCGTTFLACNIAMKLSDFTKSNVLLVDISEQKRIRDALEKEKKTLQSILFGIRDCVSIFDEQGRFMFGSTDSELLHDECKAPLLPLEAKGPVDLELVVAGQSRRFVGEIRPIYDHEGRLFAHAETLTDITDNLLLAEKERELLHFKRQLRRNSLQTEMIGTGKKMEVVFETILRCAEVDSSVLITGETGVGKELAARAIHARSHRRHKSLITVNCGALPEALIESELFGHVKGAFTGAISDRAGLFREAHGGTLFLDEIGELNKPMQVKLLRALQEHEVRPVGADRTYPVDVRIICATNRNLHTVAQQGGFRMDLYYRVAVIPLDIPPLRERPHDILRLADHFIAKHQKKDRRHLKSLNLTSRQMLLRHSWPGNIRELENAVEHALAMSRAPEIAPDCFPLQVLHPEPAVALAQPEPDPLPSGSWQSQKQRGQRRDIAEALARHDGDLAAAAKDLGISRVTLWRRRKRLAL